ncbi:MAG: cell division protein SepF [Candidatus Diapherotrites archaeon]|nr:cell division protein SepF [Candidatus Diapherotrites archaeon]
MGLFNKVMSKQDSDIEEFLNTIDEEPEENYEDADAFVKPMDLISEADATAIIKEAKSGNIVLVNIDDLSRRNSVKLKELIGRIKREIKLIDGDLARISQERIIVTPSKVKIIKRRQ